MKPLNIETAKALLDFSGGQSALEELGNLQLEGAVAIHNMIADPNVGLGYLADEVGMGKTYIALGVVALMRYFNPSLRVLYICPSRNVQEKWLKEYESFVKHNVAVSQFRIRTAKGKPAAPYVNCRNVPELISAAAMGYYADFFIGKDSFSISLNDDKETLKKRCLSIQHLLPAHEWNDSAVEKKDVKDRYAAALNYALPTFDLIIIDEAHNFKHDMGSSDRNKVLSAALGFNDVPQESGKRPFLQRVKNSLLLSATPFDRDIQQLRNQLTMVGKSDLLPSHIKNENKQDVMDHVGRFMIRRLNCLQVNGQDHTRNMYRLEHRFGDKAEVMLESDEQKLVTALVQKKVGEMMSRSGANPAFQIGMMASFESYAQTAKAEPVQFDGVDAGTDTKDAQDRHVVAHLVDSYKKADLGKTLPHPKMDTVSRQLSQKLFKQGKKQIVFVRRVKSVKELKDKLDNHFNTWLETIISKQVEDFSELKELFTKLFEQYRKESLYKDAGISEGHFKPGTEGDTGDNQDPKNDTFFAWFFRGSVTEGAQNILDSPVKIQVTPKSLRKGLVAKSDFNGLLLELNWARYIAENDSRNLADLIHENGEEILAEAKKYLTSQLKDDQLDVYRACQLGFINWYNKKYSERDLQPLLKSLSAQHQQTRDTGLLPKKMEENLLLDTFYTELYDQGLTEDLLPLQCQVYCTLKNKCWDEELFRKLNVHCHLISLSLRTGHGIIDMYLSRLRQGTAKLTPETRSAWMKDLVAQVKAQRSSSQFSTYNELYALSYQLDLIIKVNIPEVFETPSEGLRMFISRQLNPVSPIIGATGESSGNRSAQARKFRMPGYPLALISTDVFQEGEDLHTFCDSVVHYGLSGSPVSIEQKTGRVDRVHSLIQRRITDHNETGEATTEEHFIQVTFPYIKESIELLQVRQLCRNLNAFMHSLHKVGESIAEKHDAIHTDQALNDKLGIPAQITSLLTSPYMGCNSIEQGESLLSVVKEQEEQTKNTVENVESLVKDVFPDGDVFKNGFSPQGAGSPEIRIRLDSAKRSGELLLIAENAEKPAEEYCLSQDLRQTMREKSWQTLHRVLAHETASGCYKLTTNIEMLVGNETVTQGGDIRHFSERIGKEFSPKWNKGTNSETVHDFCERISTETLILNDIELKADVSVETCDHCIALEVKLDAGRLSRKHIVKIYENEGLCVFISKALTSKKHLEKFKTGEERSKKIVEYTWVRNCHVDVVEFLLDPDNDISGRVIHPVESLNWEEFVFCVYILAVEADRLEYLVDENDVL